MARVYKKPVMVVEKFVANEYVAACTPGTTTYKVVCNAGEGLELWGKGRFYQCGHSAEVTEAELTLGRYGWNGKTVVYWGSGHYDMVAPANKYRNDSTVDVHAMSTPKGIAGLEKAFS